MNIALRACIYVILGVGALVVVVPATIADITPGALSLPGLVVVCVGAGIYLRTLRDFVSVGRGTPVPLDPPRELVTSGPYRIVRNPMAIGFLLILIGEAILFGSPQILVYAVFLFLLIHLFIVLVEEPGLRRRFGNSYAAYCQSVRRWLPRLPASDGHGGRGRHTGRDEDGPLDGEACGKS